MPDEMTLPPASDLMLAAGERSIKKKSIQLGAAVTHPQKSFHLFMAAVADLYGHPF